MSEPTPPIEGNQDKLTDHAYDGIQEFDNPTPGWWWWIFLLTIVFSAGYWLVFHTTGGQLSPAAYYNRDKTQAIMKLLGSADMEPNAKTLFELQANSGVADAGKSVFITNCAQCHGPDAKGMPNSGTNLTDDVYINVKKIEDLWDVIYSGRNNNAMPAWKGRLSKPDMLLVTAYVASIRGTNVAGGKAPEGENKISEWSK